MDVTLSDESSYVIFRTVKEIATLNVSPCANYVCVCVCSSLQQSLSQCKTVFKKDFAKRHVW